MITQLNETMYDFIVIQNGNQTVSFGAFQSGLYFSLNCGIKWEKALSSYGNLANVPCSKVAFCEGDYPIVQAALIGAIVQTHDFGKHWDVRPLSEPFPYITDLLFEYDYPVSGQAYMSSLEDGVYVTSDFGQTWVPWNIGLIDHQVFCLALDEMSTVYGGTSSGLVKSKNGGRCWEEIKLPGVLAVYSIISKRDTLYLGTEKWGVLYSEDCGQSWMSLFKELEGYSVVSLAMNNDELLICTSNEVFLATLESKTVSKIEINLPEEAMILKGIAPFGVTGNKLFYVGLSNGTILNLPC